jgi:hypothetical protein
MRAKKKSNATQEQRRVSKQQVVFSVIAILVIVAWIIGLITRF